MRAIGNKIVSGLACLAALLTPASGVPHFVCRCPDGNVKPFCLSIPTPKSGGCCCGGACCSNRGAGKRCCCCSRTRGTDCARPGTRAACCGSHQRGLAESTAGFTEGPCCAKTLVAAESLAIAPEKATAGDHLRLSADSSAPPACVCAPEAGPVVHVSDLAHSPGPPADLLTLLRRLVI
jgi:hypothetical protein